MSPDSEKVKKWIDNYEKGCNGKKLDMTYALQNASLNGCGLQVIFTACYLSFVYRSSSVQVVEGPIDNRSCLRTILLGTLRIIIIVVSCGILTIPALLIKVKEVESAIIVLFTNILIPCAIASWLIMGGPVEWLIDVVENRWFGCHAKRRNSDSSDNNHDESANLVI